MRTATVVAGLIAITANQATAKEAKLSPEATAWMVCLHKGLAKYGASDAPIETIATGIMGACSEEEAAVYKASLHRSAAIRMLIGPTWSDPEAMTTARRVQQEHRDELRGLVIGELLEIKAKPKTDNVEP